MNGSERGGRSKDLNISMPQRIVQRQRSRNHRPVRLVGRKHGKRARICKKTRHVMQRPYRRIIHHRMGIVEVKSVGKWLQYATVMPTRSSASTVLGFNFEEIGIVEGKEFSKPCWLALRALKWGSFLPRNSYRCWFRLCRAFFTFFLPFLGHINSKL